MWIWRCHCQSNSIMRCSGPNPAVDPVPFGHWTLRDKAAQRRSLLRWGSPSVRHFASGHRKFSRRAFAGLSACWSPCCQRRLLVPLGRNSQALALSVAGFGSSAPLYRRCVLALHHSPCRRTDGLAAPEFGTSVPVKPPRVPLAGRCLRHTPRRVDGCKIVATCSKVTLFRTAASSLAAPSTPVAVSRVVAVSALVAPRFVGGAVAPTPASSGPAQKAAQAPQAKRWTAIGIGT